MSQAAESSGAAAAKAAEADEEPFNPTESEYKLMLLEHWRERIAGGSDALPEHDVGVNAKMRAVHRKKRKQAGHCHPMFDVAPPTFLQQYQADPSSFECDFAGMGWGDGEEDEDSAAVDSQRLQTAAAKKARSSLPLMRRYTDASLMPFGNGPFASERRQAWAATMKLVGQRYRDMFKQVQTFQMDAKKCVQMCQKRYRKDALASLKAQRDFAVRARKVSKDAGTIWRRENAQKLAAEGRLDSSALSSGDISKSRREAREVMERKRMEEAERERVRQQKRINFLLTQTELFAHFIGQKMGGITEDKGSEDASDLQPVPAAPEGEAAGGAKSKEAQMMAAAKEKGKLDKTETREALASAQAALKQRQNAMHSFDEETREATKNKGLSKKESAALAGSLDDAALQHTDVNVTAETASIFTGTLKSYQKIGFNWLVGLYEQGLNGILADEMGLGKTVQTIALLTHLSESKGIWGPFLVVAPTSTMHNWYSELQKFCPQMKVIPYFGANPNERKLLRRMWTNPVDLGTPDAAFHVLVTNYKLIIADEKHFARVQWQYMVLDEAQAVKNSASQRWKTLLGFNCRNRLLLTGTPIQNSMAELWALLHFIMPELFDSFSDFTEWFSKDIESSASGDGKGLDAAQLKRLQLILQPFMLRRTKKDVLDELVQKVEIEMRTPLSTRQRYYYDVLKNRVKATATSTELSKDEKRLHSLMNLVMQFRKVCNHPEIFERRDFVSPLQISQYVLPALPPPPTDMVVVNVVNHSTISLHLPALVYDDVAARAYWCLLNAGSRTRILTTLLSPWAVDALHRSFFPSSCPAPPPAAEEYSGMRRKGAAFAAAAAAAAAARRHAQLVHERGGGLSCVRLSGLSEGEAAFLAWASPAQRWLASLALLSREVARRAVAVYEDDECKGAGAAGIVGKAGRAEVGMPGWRSRKLPDIVLPWRAGDMEREWEGELVASASRRLHDMAPVLHVTRALTTTPQAAPARIECSRRVCMRRQAEALEDAWTRRLLLGGFASGDSPLSWQNALSCAYLAPHSLQTIPAPWPAWPSLMQSLHARIGSNSIRKPDMSKLVSDSGKLRLLDSILPKLKAGRHKVLMFCQMTKMMDILEDYFWFRKHMYLRLDGSASIADRRDMVNEFQAEDSDYFLFLLSTRAGGLGINLTAADTVIFYDSDWNPTMDAQAMDRAHRLGQTRQVTVYRLVSKNTIEERILHRAKQKDSIQRMVISGDQASAAFKGQGDSFKATDFADLLFEEEEEEEKDKEKQADVADSTLSKGRVARAPEKTQDSAAADASQKAEGAGASNGVSDANTDVAVDATCASDKHNSKAANGSVPSGAANGAQDSAAAPAPAADTTGATVEEGDVEELCDWLKVGCKVEVEWDGEWWEAIVRKIIVTAKGKTGKVEIDYVGGEEQEAEWIEISYTKLLGWVSTRVRELEPHPEPADAGPERLTVSVGGVTIGGGDVDKKSAADQKARDQMALASARSGPAIIMDMDD